MNQQISASTTVPAQASVSTSQTEKASAGKKRNSPGAVRSTCRKALRSTSNLVDRFYGKVVGTKMLNEIPTSVDQVTLNGYYLGHKIRKFLTSPLSGTPPFTEIKQNNPASPPVHNGFDWRDGVIYSIMIDRFCDGDPSNNKDCNPKDPGKRHGGDLRGVIQKLDYLQDLGVNVIQLTPVVKNPPEAYHGYWAEDFYKVDDHFGTLETFKELVSEAHKRGIKVVLDLVVNHTGPTHPFAKDPKYYNWFHHAGGIKLPTEWWLTHGELWGLPDFAQENPQVEKYLLDLGKWWVTETGVDGFRLDATRHVPHSFWKTFSQEMKKVGGDHFLLMGEVFRGSPWYLSEFQKDGIDTLLDFPLSHSVRRALGRGGDMDGIGAAFYGETGYLDPTVVVTMLDNHDLTRFMTEAGGDKDRLKMALAFLFAKMGIPNLYYGTESAMEGGRDPDNRRDMEWQKPGELVGFIKKLSQIRKQWEPLRRGDERLLTVTSHTLAFSRTLKNQEMVIALNNSEKPQKVTIPLEPSSKSLQPLLKEGTVMEDLLSGQKVTVSGKRISLTLPPKSTLILAPAQP